MTLIETNDIPIYQVIQFQFMCYPTTRRSVLLLYNATNQIYNTSGDGCDEVLSDSAPVNPDE